MSDNRPSQRIAPCAYYNKRITDVKRREGIKTPDKHITIRIDEDLFRALKIYCAANDKTIKELITELIKKELRN